MDLDDLVKIKDIEKQAWEALEKTIIYYKKLPVGTVAAKKRWLPSR